VKEVDASLDETLKYTLKQIKSRNSLAS